MKEIKRKLEQLKYEIKLVNCDDPDKMTGVMIRLEEITDLINKSCNDDVKFVCPNCGCNKTVDIGTKTHNEYLAWREEVKQLKKDYKNNLIK